MSTSFSVHVELDCHHVATAVPEAMLDALTEFHAAVGTSPRGWLDVQLTLAAETITQATVSAADIVTAAAASAGVHAQPVAIEVMTTAEFDIRQDGDNGA